MGKIVGLTFENEVNTNITNMTKTKIQAELTEKGIEYNDNMTKAELLALLEE